MKHRIEWRVFNRHTGELMSVLTNAAEMLKLKAELPDDHVIRPITDPSDELPPAIATCTVSEWLAHEIRNAQSTHAAAWARKDHIESGRADATLHRRLEQLLRLATLGEEAQCAQPVQAGGPSKQEVALTSALAQCRDAFPAPSPGSELESAWSEAMGDPESVPGYIQAIAAAANQPAAPSATPDLPSRNEVLDEAVRVLSSWEHHDAAGLLRLLKWPEMVDIPSAKQASSMTSLISSGLSALPPVGTVWQHRNGNEYMVFAILNKDSERQDEYPTTVGYVGKNGKIWSRPASRWHKSMTLIAAPAAA